MKKINVPIKNNSLAFVLVDDEDYEYLNKYKWYFTNQGYASGKIMGKNVLMHRVINKTPEGLETDHINSFKWDNTRLNLRTVTSSQNKHNINLKKHNKSGVKGVYWDKPGKRWGVSLNVNKKTVYRHHFKSLQAAFLARRWAERIYLT